MNKPLILLFLPFTLLWSVVIWYFLTTGSSEDMEMNFYSNHPVIDRIFFDGDVALAKDAFYAIEESPFSVQTRQRAYRDIQRAYQQDPDDPWVAIAASRLQMEMAYRSGKRHFSDSYHQEMLEDAKRYAERAVQSGPEESVAYSQLARIQIITGDPRTAWQTLNDAHRLDPDSFYPWYLRSVIAVQMQDPDRAHAAFEEAERRFRMDVGCKLIPLKTGSLPVVREWARLMNARMKEVLATLHNEGVILYREGHRQDAVRLADLVRQSHDKPDNPIDIEREIAMYIGEAAKRCGVTTKTIRYYESLGLLPRIPRRGAYRVFREEDLQLIRLIKQVQALGFRLSELKALLDANDFSLSWHHVLTMIQHKESELSSEIQRLSTIRQQLHSHRTDIEDCLAEHPDCEAPLKS